MVFRRWRSKKKKKKQWSALCVPRAHGACVSLLSLSRAHIQTLINSYITYTSYTTYNAYDVYYDDVCMHQYVLYGISCLCVRRIGNQHKEIEGIYFMWGYFINRFEYKVNIVKTIEYFDKQNV